MLTQDYIGLALVYGLIVVVLAFALILDKKGSKADIRKVVHIGVGFFVFIWWMFTERWIMLVFFALPFVVLLFFAMAKDNVIGKSKLGEISQDKGHKPGLFLYAISITLIVLASFGNHWSAGSIGIIAMTFGDGFGSVIGKKYGKHKGLNGKSIEGSIAVFVATTFMSFILISFYGWLILCGYYVGDVHGLLPFWALAMIAGAVATTLEAVCPGQYDNLATPLVVAGVMASLGL